MLLSHEPELLWSATCVASASILRFEVYLQVFKLSYERIKNKNRFIGTFRTGDEYCSLCCSSLDTSIHADTMSSPYVVLVFRVESKLPEIVTSFSSFEIQLGDTWVMERTLFDDHEEWDEWQRQWRPETHFNCLNLGEDVESCTSKGVRARCEQIYPYILVERACEIQCFDEIQMISPGKRHNHRKGNGNALHLQNHTKDLNINTLHVASADGSQC